MTRAMKLFARMTFVLALGMAGVASAQDAFPGKGTIEMTVLFPAGSSADVTARLLADGMSKQLGTSVIVINRPGAGGAIGYRYVASQNPDGYAIVWNSNSISTTFHSGTLAFNYEGFAPVAQVLVESPIVAVRGDSKWQSLGDLVAAAKANPKMITIGNSGVGSHTHISSGRLFQAAGVSVVDVPFGAAQVITGLLGGQVDAIVQLPAALSEHVKSGGMRLLTAMTPNRDPAFPDVPTARELGYDVSLEAWRGIAVPKDTPKAVIAALEAAIEKTVRSEAFVQACAQLGARPAFKPAVSLVSRSRKKDAELAKLMAAIGLKK